MLRHVIAASLVLLGTNRINAAAALGGPTTVACHSACVMANDNLPSVRDAMDDGVARIAARATVAGLSATPLTQSDLVGLYLLLSLQAKAQGDVP